jgi:hypothetical protein
MANLRNWIAIGCYIHNGVFVIEEEKLVSFLQKANKRVHTERHYTLSVMIQILSPSGDAQGVSWPTATFRTRTKKLHFLTSSSFLICSLKTGVVARAARLSI